MPSGTVIGTTRGAVVEALERRAVAAAEEGLSLELRYGMKLMRADPLRAVLYKTGGAAGAPPAGAPAGRARVWGRCARAPQRTPPA